LRGYERKLVALDDGGGEEESAARFLVGGAAGKAAVEQWFREMHFLSLLW
jgi:hypothetical protein